MEFDKLKVGLINLTVGHWDLMAQHAQSLYQTYPYPKEFYIIPNLDYKLSLSGAINKGFRRAMNDGMDYLVYCADDVIAGEDSVQTLVSTLAESDYWVVHGEGPNSGGWDFFACKPVIFGEIGFWDESFYPAYFEDNDWARRLEMYDNTRYHYRPINFTHLGSQTIQRMSGREQQRHHESFGRLQSLYELKWGGPPGAERYAKAWNGEACPSEYMGYPVRPTEYWPESAQYKHLPGF